MDTSALAAQIAQKVVADTQFWVALVGLLGAIVGSLLTIAGQLLLHYLQDRPRHRLDAARKELLKTMLEDERFLNKWRQFTTLSHVLGADDETTKRLLIEVGARASEKEDGLWGLIKYHPFRETER